MHFKLTRCVATNPYRVIARVFMLAALCALGLPASSRQGAAAVASPAAQELRRLYSLPSSQWPAASLDEGVEAPELAPLPPVVYPRSSPFSVAKEKLGYLLFFDPRLSASGQVACASCHDPQFGWADGKRRAIGFARLEGPTNTPSIVNAAYEKELFWDGRASSLEVQIAGSLGNAVEMNTSVFRATAQIASIKPYLPLIKAAYGDTRVNWSRLCDAIATYVRGITLRETDYDRFLGGDVDALSDAALRGLHLFRTRARCMNCHNGALLSDGSYHHLGTSFYGVENYQGRYAVTHEPSDMGKFRTPGLRGVFYTGPWTHNGLIADLDELLLMYDKGWWQNDKPSADIDERVFPKLDPLIRPLHLGPGDLADLKALLASMSPRPSYLPLPVLPGQAANLRPRLHSPD